MPEVFGRVIVGPDNRTLATLRTDRMQALQDRRRAAIERFAFSGQTIALTGETQRDIANAVSGLERQDAGATIDWEIVDGAYVSMTLAQLQAMGDAAFGHVQACYTNSKALAAAILAATTRAAVAAVNLETGWPS